MVEIDQNSKFNGSKTAKMAFFELLEPLENDFTKNSSGRNILQFPHCAQIFMPLRFYVKLTQINDKSRVCSKFREKTTQCGNSKIFHGSSKNAIFCRFGVPEIRFFNQFQPTKSENNRSIKIQNF